jgi:FlaA1/EpsC-like NDP-sugar epimerase
MVATLVFSVIASFAIYQIVWRYRSLQRNIALAKSSGLPVVVSPVYTFSILWLSTFKLWTPLLERLLPETWKGLWFEYVHSNWHRRGIDQIPQTPKSRMELYERIQAF